MILRLKWQLYLPTRLKWQLSQNTKRQISGGDPLVAGPCALPERCPALPRGERGRLGQRCTAGHRGDGQARGRAIRKTFRSFSGLKRRTWFVGGDTIRIYKGNIGPIWQISQLGVGSDENGKLTCEDGHFMQKQKKQVLHKRKKPGSEIVKKEKRIPFLHFCWCYKHSKWVYLMVDWWNGSAWLATKGVAVGFKGRD